ncbi:Dihydrolipoamide dehydrogenase of 2-oxoglutarate dehydrogenase [hydrothermal vent metagenome]|uniref:Dihydrolipoyl dehydrogenase n=1 Tax=hydrothermal vent metagenome TaxID=652676 RepID=A0A3B1AJV1_9ZZZZ
MENFDVIIIGAGPAGYVAAIRCAQLGKKTAIINKSSSLGGTCLNVGCIPSKALLESSELYSQVQSELQQHGINVAQVSLDLAVSQQRKQKIVTDLTSGISLLMKSNAISVYHGEAILETETQVSIKLTSGSNTMITASNIILAPGSKPAVLKSALVDDNLIVDSTGALTFEAVPESLAIIGAGVIGVELGSVWQRYGSKVVVYEFLDSLLPIADHEVSQQATKLLKKQGLEFHFASQVTATEIDGDKVKLSYKDSTGEHSKIFNKVLVATGRIANTNKLCSNKVKLNIDEKGFIKVDAQCKTNIDTIYAIGDAVRGPMLAHKASGEAIMVAELISGNFAKVNYDIIPFIIYTHPEIAWCGATEQQLKQNNIAYNVGKFHFMANGRAKAAAETDGFIKIIADKKTDRILGVHMIGSKVSELIMQAVIAMEFNASSEDLALTMFAHPTLSEALHEAASDVSNTAIHSIR